MSIFVILFFTSFLGCKKGWKRFATTFRIEYIEKLQTRAFLQKRPANLILDEALEEYFKNKNIEKIR